MGNQCIQSRNQYIWREILIPLIQFVLINNNINARREFTRKKYSTYKCLKKILKFICGQNICKIIMAVKTDSARSPSFFPNNKSSTQKEVVPVSWATRQKNSTCIIYRYQKSGEYSRTSIDWAKSSNDYVSSGWS